MVAIVTGAGLGVSRSSAWVLGSRGQLGQATLGRGGENVYVNAANGNLVIQNLDDQISSVGSDMAIGRTYNSLGALDGDNNDGWRQSVMRKVDALVGTINTAGSKVTRTDWDGSEVVYNWDASRAAYVSREGAGAINTLTLSGTTWIWTEGSTQIVERYDQSNGGMFTGQTDADGNQLLTVMLTYDETIDGQALLVTSASGDTISLQYSGTHIGRVVQYGTLRTRVRYGYDALDRLTTVTVDQTPDDFSITDGKTYVTTYTYDGTSKRVASIGQTDGSRLAITYTLVGSLYQVATLTQTVSATETRTTTFAYDTALRQTTVTDAANQQTVLTYDAAGQLIKIKQPPAVSGGTNPTTEFTYDAVTGDVLTVKIGAAVTTYSYDSNGNRTLERDPLGNTVTRTFGANNLLLTETHYLVANSTQASDGVTTRYAYDVENHLRFVVSSEGRVTAYGYDGYGSRTVEISLTSDRYNLAGLAANTALTETQVLGWWNGISDKSSGVRTDTAYDFRGNVTSVTRFGRMLASGPGDLSDPSEVSRMIYVYDQAGNLISRVSDATGAIAETFVYDSLGRVIASTDLSGGTTSVVFDDANSSTIVTTSTNVVRTSVYNRAGELLSETETTPAVSYSAETYAAEVHRLYQTALGRAPNGLELTANVQFLSQGVGNLEALATTIMASAEFVNKAGSGLTNLQFANYLWTTALHRAIDAPTTAWIAGLIDSGAQTRASVMVRIYSESLEERMITTPLVSAGLAYNDVTVKSYQYDVMGRLRRVTDGVGSKTYFVYDRDGRKVADIHPDGGLVEYVYDDQNLPRETIQYKTPLTAAQIATLTNGAGMPSTVELAGVRPATNAEDRVAWRVYDSAQRLVETIDAYGAATIYAYDGASRLVSVTAYATLIGATTIAGYRTAPPTSVITPTANAAKDRVARHFYDADGLELGVLDGEGFLTRSIYDNGGRIIETVGYGKAANLALRAGGTFAALLTDVGADVTDIHNYYLYDGRGLLRASIDGEGGLTRLHYNKAGYLDEKIVGQKLNPATLLATPPKLSTLPAAGGTEILERTTYARDSRGNVTTETRYLTGGTTEVTTNTYNSRGYINGSTTVVDGVARVTTLRYDLQRNSIIRIAGGEASQSLANLGATPSNDAVDAIYAGQGEILVYDAEDRLVRTQEANGTDIYGPRSAYFYDANGRLVVQTNAQHQVTEYNYNVFGEKTSTILHANALFSDVTGGQADAQLAAMLNSIARPDLDTTNLTQFDRLGRVSQTTDASGRVTTYSYNAFGELMSTVAQLDGGATVMTSSDYDRRGVSLGQTRDAGGGTLQLSTFVGSDAFGRPRYITDPSGVTRRLDYDRAGRVIVQADGLSKETRYSYDGRGSVKTVTDRTGAVTSYNYTAFNRQMVITTPEGISTTTVSNANGEVVSVTDGGGRVTVYTYNRDGALKTVTDAAGATTNSYDLAGRLVDVTGPSGRKTHFTYDVVDRVLSRTEDYGGLNLVTNYAYDVMGRQVSVKDPSNVETITEYDQAGRQTAVRVNASGVTLRTEYTYDKAGRVLTVTEAAGTSAAKVVKYTYDAADRRIATQIDPAGLNLTTSYTYDKAGNVVATVDAAGATTRYVYDGEHRVIWTVDGVGTVTNTAYDGEGRVLVTRTYANQVGATALAQLLPELTVLAASQLVAVATGDELNRYVYDANGRLRYTLDATMRPTKYSYDNAGNLIRKVASSVVVSPTGYTVGEMDTAVANLTAAEKRVTRAIYDAANRLAFSIDEAGQVTAYSYDLAGNMVKVRRYETTYADLADVSQANLQTWSNTLSGAAIDEDRISRTVYDGAGRAVYQVDPEGYVTETQYDVAGRVTKSIRYADRYAVNDSVTKASLAALIGNPAGAVSTSYTYDTAGRLTDITDPVGVVTHMVLDAMGQVTDLTRAYGSATDASTTHRTYDKAGRLVSETRGYVAGDATAGSTTTSTYDGVGRLTSTTNGRGYTTWYGYDAAGHLKTQSVAHDVSVTVNTVFDVTRYDYDAFGNRVKVTDARNNVGYFYYDVLNRLTLQVDPEGYGARTEYSLGGQVISVKRYYTRGTGPIGIGTPPSFADDPNDATTTIARDKLDRVVATTDAMNFTESYVLNAFGDRVSTTNRLGGVTTSTYDKRGLLTDEVIVFRNAAAGVTQQSVTNHYDYDGRGNRIKAIEAYGLPEQRTTQFAYDALDRLVEEKGDAVMVLANDMVTASAVTPTQTLKYDKRGNIIESIDATNARTLYYYDALDRKIGQLDALGTLSTWTYDKASNAVSAKIYADPIALPTPAGGAQPQPVAGAPYREVVFGYDYANRQVTASSPLPTGQFNGSAWGYVFAWIGTTTDYDALGNIVRQVDGRGGETFNYYDKAGRQVATVDQEKYLTLYTRDAEGNVLTEDRLAQRLTGTINVNTPISNLVGSPRDVYQDRTTTFTYDRNGRRLTETRANVKFGSVDVINGLLTEITWNSTISYTYNGLGEIIKKTEAVDNQYFPDYVEYGYDLQGRQITATSAPFVDYTFVPNGVQHRTETAYDGLNNVVWTREGKLNADAAIDRITTYSYIKGRLDTTIDAAGFARHYAYDAAGRVVREHYDRGSSGSTTYTEANVYRYDALGRVILQTTATYANGVTFGDKTWLRYNAYGEATGKGITAGTSATPVYQETFDYDAYGRMWRSTAGDGVVRAHLYDGAGAETLTISSVGTDLSGYTSFDALAAGLGVSGAIGSTFLAGVTATITVYDKRGQATETREAFREINTNAANPAVNDTALIRTQRTYNAFGEVTSETNARNYTTNFSYNTLGKLIQKQSPWVNVTAENGAVTSQRPTENYYYDLSGRLVGVEDANSNLSTRYLLAGSGHGGEDAIALTEFHAGANDQTRNGVARVGVDVFGDIRQVINELGYVEQRDYDKMGRLTTLTHQIRAGNTPGNPINGSNPNGLPQGLIDNYAYDGLGQRIRHWNSQFGSGAVETTDYDSQGRVIRTVSYAGDVTSYGYVFNASIATSYRYLLNGTVTTTPVTVGGWTKTTTHVSGLTSVETLDYFGHMTTRTDLGGHQFNYVFDKGGRVIEEKSYTSGFLINTRNYTYYNTGKLAVVADQTDNGNDHVTAKTVYGYDVNGNRLAESYTTRNYGRRAVYSYGHGDWYDNYYEPVVSDELYDYTTSHQNAVVTYDALNRMVRFTDSGQGGIVPATIDYEYDAAGNVRHMVSSFRTLDFNGTPYSSSTSQNYWYRYDSMNRFVTTKGVLQTKVVNGVSVTEIVRGMQGGSDILYNVAGQRESVLSTVASSETYDGPLQQPDEEHYKPWRDPITVDYVKERRENYAYTEDGYLSTVSIGEDSYNTTTHAVVAMGAPVQRVRNERDLLGQVINYFEYDASGATATYSRYMTYNLRSEITQDIVSSTTAYSVTTNDYNALSGSTYTGAYLGGAVTHSRTQTTASGTTTTSDTATSYVWWDGARQGEVVYKPNVNLATTNRSSFFYDTSGRISAVSISDGRPRTVTYVTNAEGQILSRREADNNAATGDPRQLRYQFDGRQLGDVSNDGPSDTDYITALAQRGAAVGAGAFKGGAAFGVSAADFDQSYDPINPTSEGTADTRITTREGDTLRSIAAQVWGDEAMWYLIAQANGLSASDAIAAGMTLIIPAKVANIHNTSATFRVYDPNKAIGDVNPTAQAQPKPQAKAKGCGTMGKILVVVIAVAVTYLSYGALKEAAAAMVSTAFTAVGVPTTVAAAAATATTVAATTATVLAGAMAAAAGSVVSQAFAVATGIQDKFSWKGVAMAAIAGGVGGGVGPNPFSSLSGTAQAMARGAVSNIVAQGVGVATGLQDKFDWKSVAVGAVVSGVSTSLSNASWMPSSDKAWSLAGMTNSAVSGAAGALAGAATRSLIDGSDFGDNILKALPDVIGSTVGNMIAGQIQAKIATQSAEKRSLQAAIAESKSSAFAGQDASGIASILEGRAAGQTDDPIGALIAISNNSELSNGFLKAGAAYATLRDSGVTSSASVRDVLKLKYSGPAIGQPGGSNQQAAPNDVVVVGRGQTFGSLVGGSAVSFGNWLGDGNNAQNVGLVTAGLAVLKGGPVGFALDYASGQAVNYTLKATGLDKNVAQFASYVNGAGLSLLDHGDFRSVPNYSGTDASSLNVADGGAFGQASSVVLGTVALGGGLVAGKSWVGSKLSTAESRVPLSYDISDWGSIGLPSDGRFARTLTREQYLDFKAGADFSFGGKPTPGYEGGMGFIGSAEEAAHLTTSQSYRDGLRLDYDPKYVLEFQLKDYSGLQNVLDAPYSEFVPGGKSGAGLKEFNFPGIRTKDLVNAKVRELK